MTVFNEQMAITLSTAVLHNVMYQKKSFISKVACITDTPSGNIIFQKFVTSFIRH